jgi:uncharacterized protein YegP (UPF0339 family)
MAGVAALDQLTLSVTPLDNGSGEPMAGKLELTKDKPGKFGFRLKAPTGEIIATSEAYESKAGARNAVSSAQKNAAGATVVDLTQ